MRLVDRIASWLKAESHGVVDAMEDKGLLLKQAVRDAQLALDGKRSESEVLRSRHKQSAALLERLREEGEALDADLELALEREQDDLARYTARKLLPMRQHRIDTERSLIEIDERRVELDETIARQARELELLELRVNEYLQRQDSGGTEPNLPSRVSDEEVELELLRRRRKAGA